MIKDADSGHLHLCLQQCKYIHIYIRMHVHESIQVPCCLNHQSQLQCSIPHQSALNFDILGAPIGNEDFCASFIEKRRLSACELLSLLPKLCDPQLSLGILRQCASFCILAHLAQCSPPTPAVLELLANFDDDMLHCPELNFSFHQWQVGKHSSVFVMEVLASAPYYPMLQLHTSLWPVFLLLYVVYNYSHAFTLYLENDFKMADYYTPGRGVVKTSVP